VPVVTTDDDFSNFVNEEDDGDGPDPLQHNVARSRDNGFKGEELPFIGYSYTRSLNYGGKQASMSQKPSIERSSSVTSMGMSRVFLLLSFHFSLMIF